jgi:2-oxopent-4-enoate/cis-2-oxohex-4-enoate hydratase
MTLNSQQIEALASSLWEARITQKGIPPLTETEPGLTLTEAYQISRLNFEKRCRQPGVKPIGRKIGLTSQAVQSQLGVSEPDFGYLTSDMVLESGATLRGPQGRLLQGKVEGEVAFVLKRDLKGPGVTSRDVAAATDYVVACIEIIDSRVRDWKIRIQDTIADNASSALFVLGSQRKRIDELDLRMAGMTLRKNGEVESTGVGAACMDHPLQAVAWLANKMGALGEILCAGEIILSGAYGPVVSFAPGDHCEVEISGLGKVTCTYGQN